MNHEEITSAVERQLKERRAAVERRGESTLVVSKRNVLGKNVRAELDLSPLFAAMDAPDAPVEAVTWVASFAEGVDRELSSHKSRLVAKMSFVDAAGRLMMRLEGPGFPLGVVAAGGEMPLLREWMPGVLLSYWIEMDQFILVLSEAKFEAWGCTYDRVFAAGRSLLYAKTRYHEMHPYTQNGTTVDMYAVGDGYDPARALIMPELDFDRCYKGLWVSVPGQTKVLVANRADTTREAFEATTRAAFESEEYPLSGAIYELTRSAFSAVEA